MPLDYLFNIQMSNETKQNVSNKNICVASQAIITGLVADFGYVGILMLILRTTTTTKIRK
ncbi:hypothetical protein DERP_006920 [Dermatophagoides pteronyssinus]|uniref:Uncharacterized protein n=1 Tax=Dermatophagoides pteronyssinus TaxID=6956 RepID=A0ABQ8ISI1_DERPT|nr:hypothetical protein DERP_006920 [Dermatophagoides pteronyssinus]